MLDALKTALTRRKQTVEQQQAAKYEQLLRDAIAGKLDEKDLERVEAVLAETGRTLQDLEIDINRHNEMKALEDVAAHFDEAAAAVKEAKQQKAALEAEYARATEAFNRNRAELEGKINGLHARMQEAGAARDELRRRFPAESRIGAVAVLADKRKDLTARIEQLRRELADAEWEIKSITAANEEDARNNSHAPKHLAEIIASRAPRLAHNQQKRDNAVAAIDAAEQEIRNIDARTKKGTAKAAA